MSKKKASSTMSLKDFHGGSIPSDLSLPSAPGVVVRPALERNMSVNWGNNLIRSDLWPRPKSSGATHSFDEKATLYSHPAPLGRNFDEDERKPLDGLSAPRRTISDESIRSSAPVHQEPKPDNVSSIRVLNGPTSSPAMQSPSLVTSLYTMRLGAGTSDMVNSQNPMYGNSQVVNNFKSSTVHNGQDVYGNPPNAWGVKNNMMTGEMGCLSASSGPNTKLKFAQASAIEKVSSGLWQSKNPNQLLPNSPYLKDDNVTNSVNVGGQRVDYDGQTSSEVAEDQKWDGSNFGRGQIETHTKMVPAGASSTGSHLLPAMPPKVSERPKSNYLPRSKLLEISEDDYRQGYHQSTDSAQIETVHELHGNANPPISGSTNARMSAQQVERSVERPKLNLKPRSKPLEQSDGSLERERNALFGGARPRELVLKERGIDDIVVNNLDLSNSPDRVNLPKNEATSEHLVSAARHGQKVDHGPSDRITLRNSEKKNQQTNHDKVDPERKTWKNEKWRSSRDTKSQRPEPETWRKPIDEPKPASPDATGANHGKLASALELAQAFSKSVSASKSPDPHSPQRGLPGRDSQVPFSRLTDTQGIHSAPTSRHRINGY